MTQRFAATAIDLSQVLPPNVVEDLDYESYLEEYKADFVARFPDYNVEALESDPVVKVLQVAAYREKLLRARVNDSARAVMLALAFGEDLDHLGYYYGVKRDVITPATDIDPAILEDDERFRRRIQLAPEALSVAGPEGAYRFHTLQVDDSIKSVGVVSNEPGSVDILPLVSEGDGTPSAELLARIAQSLSAENVRPLTDVVQVRAPELVNYQVVAQIKVANGPDANLIRQNAEDSLKNYLASRHVVGQTVFYSGLIDALHVPGVEQAVLLDPTGDIEVGETQVAYAASTDVTVTP